MQNNEVHHITTSPYHPTSNGITKRAVQTFKSGMKKLTEGTLETQVTWFLFHYHIPHHYRAIPSRADTRKTAQDTPGPSQA